MNAEINTTTHLYEDDPVVSMAVSTRDHIPPGYVIDFDYDAYHEVADALAGEPVDLTGKGVVLVDDLPNGIGGVYHSDTVHVANHLSGQDKQKFLQHETKHMTDHTAGDHRGQSTLSYRIGRRIQMPAVITELTSAAGTLGVVVADKYSDNPTVNEVAQVVYNHTPEVLAIPVVSGVVAAAGLLRYLLDPAEVRARAAEKIELPQVFSIQPIPRDSGKQ